MKRILFLLIITVLAFSSHLATAGETNITAARIGTYDSRVVAYAWFWSDAGALKRKEMVDAVDAAKKAGDTGKLAESEMRLQNARADNHRQVFSTMPVDDVLAIVKDQLSGLKEKANVTELVSKWDEATLKKYPDAKKVDVTDQLIRLFLPHPNEKQLRVIEGVKTSTPLSREKCDELIRDGKF